VSVPASGTYTAGQNLDFTVNFDSAVTVDTSGGTPRLALILDIGGSVSANYLSGSGTSALVFRYTVVAGNADANGVAVGALSANGGTLRDAAGNNAVLTLNSVGSTAAVFVDAVGPVVANVTSSTANGTYKLGDSISLQVVFNEVVTVTGTPQITLETGATDRVVNYASGSGTSTLVFTYTVQSGDTSADLDYTTTSALALSGGTIRDALANDAVLTLATPGAANSLGANKALVIDGALPSVASIVRHTPSAASIGVTSVTFRITFSEAVSGVDAADFVLTTTGASAGSIDAVTPVSAAIYDVVVGSIAGAGTLRLDLDPCNTGITDAAGNDLTSGFNAGEVYTVLGAPVISSALTANVTAGNAFTYTITATNSPASFSATGLPGWLAINTSTGALTGTGSSVGVSNITIGAANAGGTTTATLVLTVTAPPAPPPVSPPAVVAATVTLSSTTQVYNGSPRAVSVVTSPANLDVTVTYDGVAAPPAAAGTYAVAAAVTTAGFTGSASGTLTIQRAAQTLSFAATADRSTSAPAFTLGASASSGLPVSFTLVSGPATVSGTTLTLTGAPGVVTVKASQAGSANHEAAPDITRSFRVETAGPRLFFAHLLEGGNKVGDVAAFLPASGNVGRVLIVAPPPANLNLVIAFTVGSDGTFRQTVVDDSGGSPAAEETMPPMARAPRTLTFRGTLDGGLLAGRFEELPFQFSAAAQGSGPSSAAAGFYTSSTLNAATGSTTTLVGNNREVLALASNGATRIGGRTTLDASGRFIVVSDGVTLNGAVDSVALAVAGTLTQTGRPTIAFSGIALTAAPTDRLVNLSSRVRVGPGSGRTLITGFVIGGSAAKRVLLRAVGPGLALFNLPGALNNPRLEVYDATGTRVLQNDDWSGADTAAAFGQVGAFTLAPGTRDAALLTTLAPGAYTMHVPDGGETGVVLAEIYDAGANGTTEAQRLVNISSRGFVEPGEGTLIGGFVVAGNVPKRLLIRGVGPALAGFNVPGALADPRLAVYDGQTVVAQNDNWGTPTALSAGQSVATAAELAAAAQAGGAFALAAGSKDAAVIVTLAPGAYTAQVTAVDGSTGAALVEIYELHP
jgi:hypothetical protein